MHLAQLRIENFRIFGDAKSDKSLSLELRPGLNVLVGENDSGKTAIVDALRFLLWTTANDYQRLSEDDFHVEAGQRAQDLTIAAQFQGLTQDETAAYLEWLTLKKGHAPVLDLTLKASLRSNPPDRGRGRVSVTVRTGREGSGPSLEGDVREDLRATYLKPLRDAESELSSGRGSRLSQILMSHPEFDAQSIDDFVPGASAPPQTLVGIMRQAERQIEANGVIKGARDEVNNSYLEHLSLATDRLSARVGIARRTELREILERLDLSLVPPSATGLPTRRGLGHNNVLFMATELLLLGKKQQVSPLLLLEEPEAHLHPQMQLRLMDFLNSYCKDDSPKAQILLTTHSPNLASIAPLQSMTLVSQGAVFPLGASHTMLDPSDYRFLERFLDVTKSNLFFAKAVVIVEGDAENILLPTIADLLGRSFSKYGVSVVKVGHRGFFRYSRIFRRVSAPQMPVRVACLADRDIPPDEASGYLGEGTKTESGLTDSDKEARLNAAKREEGGTVKVFVSPGWTLEHDLALHGLPRAVNLAVMLAKAIKAGGGATLSPDRIEKVKMEAKTRFDGWVADKKSPAEWAALVYEDFFKGRASKTEAAYHLSQVLTDRYAGKPDELRKHLPDYILDAIDYVTLADQEDD